MKLLYVQKVVFAASEIAAIEADNDDGMPKILVWMKNDNEMAYEFGYKTDDHRDRDFFQIINNWKKALE